jgi:hypothetical protein
LSNEIDRLKQKVAETQKEKLAVQKDKGALQEQLVNASQLLAAAIQQK